MSHASVKATNFPLYLRHKDFLGELTTVDTDLDRNDATFDIVPVNHRLNISCSTQMRRLSSAKVSLIRP